GLERGLRSARRGRTAEALVGRQEWQNRPQRSRALEAVRFAAGAGKELADARAETARQDSRLGRRGRRLLPQQRGPPARRLPVTGEAGLRRQDHLRDAGRPWVGGVDGARGGGREGEGGDEGPALRRGPANLLSSGKAEEIGNETAEARKDFVARQFLVFFHKFRPPITAVNGNNAGLGVDQPNQIDPVLQVLRNLA